MISHVHTFRPDDIWLFDITNLSKSSLKCCYNIIGLISRFQNKNGLIQIKRLFQIANSSHRCLATSDNERYSTNETTDKTSFRSNLPPFVLKREQASLI